jgi:hypothetical protein
LLAFGIASPAQAAAGGATSDCGAYCPGAAESPSGNGHGRAAVHANENGLPDAGSVGSADSMNPPGQAPDGTDSNNGYECDGNAGVGLTNPAHTGCAGPEDGAT